MREPHRYLFDLLVDETYPWDTLQQKHQHLAIEILARLIVQTALSKEEKGKRHD